MATDSGIEFFKQMEASPFIFIEDVSEQNPQNIEIVRTRYSEDYMRKILEPVYLGHKFNLFTSFTGNQFDHVPVENIELPIAQWIPTSLDYQSLETPPPNIGDRLLLNLPDYAASRIRDMAVSLGGEVEENIRIFLNNNTYTFYSRDRSEELTIFCPLFAIERVQDEHRHKIKFLRIDRRTGQFSPYIYSVTLGNKLNDWYHCLLQSEEFVDGIQFSIKINKVESDHLFDGYSLYYSGSLRNIPLEEYPDDCNTITQFLCGLTLQPDPVRYHSLFKSLRKRTNDFGVELSSLTYHENREFLENRIVNRSPANEISILWIETGNPPADAESDEVIERNGVRLTMNEIGIYDFYMKNSMDELIGCLDAFECNQPNCLFFFAMGHKASGKSHAATLYYDKEYRIYDAQNKENYGLSEVFEQGYDVVQLFTITTDIPEKRNLLVPEFPIAHDYNRSSFYYIGDIYPLVRSGIDLFRYYRGHFPVRGDLGRLLQIVDNPIAATSLDEKGIPDTLLEDFHNSSLLLLFQPTPVVSFTKVYQTEALLERALQNLNHFSGLKAIRHFVNRFLLEEEPFILQHIRTGFFRTGYTAKELNDFLYSRPLYISIMKEILDLYPQQKTAFSQAITEYLSRQRKPVLRLVPLYLKVLELAKADGTKEYFVRYLSRLRDKSRTYLTGMARQMSLNGEAPFAELATQIYSSLKRYFSNFERQKRSVGDRAKVNVAADYAKHRILQSEIYPEEINEFIAEQQRVQWAEYLAQLEQENVQNRQLGLPEETPSETERVDILKIIMVTQEMIDKVKQSVFSFQQRPQRPPVHYDQVLKESYITDYLYELISEETDRLLATPLSQWPQDAIERVQREAQRLLRVSFATEEDHANAMNAFVTLMNLVVIESPTFTEKYLGSR